jgi:hypothetical protein
VARRKEPLIVGVVFVVSIAAQLLRQTGERSWRTVWAEDGRVFYGGTHDLSDLLSPHAGYMQLPGRTLGLIAQLVPIGDLSLFYAFAGATVTSLCALAVWYFSEELIGSVWLRAVLALQLVLLPTLLLEQLANGVNTLWAVLFAGWWALLYLPRRRAQVVAPAAVVAVAAMSSALAFAFVPVAAVLAWRRAGLYRIVAVAFAAGCVVQAAVALGASDDTVRGAGHLGDLPGVFSTRVLASMLVGEQWVDDGWQALGWGLGVLAAVIFVVVLVVVLRRSRGEAAALGVVSIVYGAGLYCLAVWGRGTVMMRIPDTYNSIGNRWSSLAIWFITSGVVLCIAGNPRAVFIRWATIATVGWFVVVSVAGFRGSNPRSPGPDWQPSVESARHACADGDHPVTLAVVPYPFDVTISCAELRTR